MTLKRITHLALLAILIGCNKVSFQENEEFFTSHDLAIGSKTNPIVYNVQTNSWLEEGIDPYRLSIFKSILETISEESANSITATHYALKVYPKTVLEQETLELNSKLRVAYYPFNHKPLSPDLCPSSSLKSISPIIDERRYTSVDIIENNDGSTREEKTLLPVLYIVWPADETIPPDLDYNIDYEIFIPNHKNSNDYIRQAEIRAQVMAGNRTINTKAEATNGSRIFSGYIVNYDNLLDSNVVMENLKIRFQLGSNIVDTYTSPSGYFGINAPYGSSVSCIFLHNRWKITESNSSTPIELSLGPISDTWVNGSVTNIDSDECAVHRAMSYYFLSYHPIAVPNSQYMVPVKMTRTYPVWSGSFTAPLFSAPYIEISNFLNYMDGHVFATVCHEMGHYSHYMYKNSRLAYDSMHSLFKESFADYVAWVLSHNYYAEKTGLIPYGSLGWDNDFLCDNQTWKKNDSGDASYYSPLFIDMIDDNNQYYTQGDGDDYNYDVLNNIPHSLIKSLVTDNRTWSQIKAQMQDYVGVYFQQAEYNSFITPYNYYFQYN